MLKCCCKFVILLFLGDAMFFMETVFNKNYSDINPVQFGYETCDSSHYYGPAVRTYWLLQYVVSGKGHFKINGKNYSIIAGNTFVIPPYVETYYEADCKDPWEYIWIGFNKSDRVKVIFDDVIYAPSAQHIFEDMKRCSDMYSGRTEFLCSKIWQLIAEISDKKNVVHDYIKQALSIINSEYMLDITVQNIADRIGLERTYFSNRFKNVVGISPKEYIIRTRMEQAKLLLRKHGYGVSLTALSVGYSDTYTFSKMFKRYFGISPSGYVNQ